MPGMRDAYQRILLGEAGSDDPVAEYDLLMSLVRSVLQTSAFVAVDLCYELTHDVTEAAFAARAQALCTPNDGATEELLSECIVTLRQAGHAGCAHGWFESPQHVQQRMQEWLRFRNDRHAHGAMNKIVRAEAMRWLPKLAKDLVDVLSDLLPDVAQGEPVVTLPGASGRSVPIRSWRPHLEKGQLRPTVVRAVEPRDPAWRMRYQVLDREEVNEGAWELAREAPLVLIVRGDHRRYRSFVVRDEKGGVWRPTVLAPGPETQTFVGRTTEMEAIHAWMDDPDSRLGLVFGEGGIGKTTLVLEYLHRILNGVLQPPTWRPDIIVFYSAKETRWTVEGMQLLKGAQPTLLEAVREFARCYEDRLGREWFTGEPKQVVDRAVGLAKELGLDRNRVLLVLDNAETLARHLGDEPQVAEILHHIGRRLCRVLVTSRRRELIEAFPIPIAPLSDAEGAQMLRRLVQEFGAKALSQAPASKLESLNRRLGGRPLLLHALALSVGRFRYSIDRALATVETSAEGDLGRFLYEDAWDRMDVTIQIAFLVLARLGSIVPSEALELACEQLQIPVDDFLRAFEETRFGQYLGYGARYEINLDATAVRFFAAKHEALESTLRGSVDRSVETVRGRLERLRSAENAVVDDRVRSAFACPEAKAAHQCSQLGDVEGAVAWYERAIQRDPGNAALLERFAWYLMHNRRYERAIELAQVACARAPRDADAHFTLGMSLGRAGRLEESEKALEQARLLGKAQHLCRAQLALAVMRHVEVAQREKNQQAADLLRLLDEARTHLQHAASIDARSNSDRRHLAEADRLSRRVNALREQLLG